MRNYYFEQLELLNIEMTKMGALCESAIASSAKSVFNADEVDIKKTKQYEEAIDRKEKEIETLCVSLLLRQQPVASDFRYVSAALKIISDMERIGDQACDIAEIAALLGGFKLYGDHYLSEMARAATNMVTDCVEAFIQKNQELALKVIDSDDVVDDYFTKIREELIQKISEDSKHGSIYLDYLMIAKYFERIGDHAQNIAEWVIFSITGEHWKG